MKLDKDTYLAKCKCHSFEFLQVWRDTYKCNDYHFTLSYYPKTILEKINAIWAVIKGSRNWMSEEVILSKSDLKDLINFLKE